MPRTSATHTQSYKLKNIVVFASGSGSNFQSIIDAISTGSLQASITGLITDRDQIKSIERAQFHNIPYTILSPASFVHQSVFESTLLNQLEIYNTDLIVLAGYLKKIPGKVIRTYRDRILNIHPSLLPKYGGKGFYGIKVHEAVLLNEEIESGCTVHVVNEVYDDGPVLAQSKVPVYKTDTASDLASRVLIEEHKLYPKVISEYLKRIP